MRTLTKWVRKKARKQQKSSEYLACNMAIAPQNWIWMLKKSANKEYTIWDWIIYNGQKN